MSCRIIVLLTVLLGNSSLSHSLCSERMQSGQFDRTQLIPWARSFHICQYACFLMGYCGGIEWAFASRRCSWSDGRIVKTKLQEKGVTRIKIGETACEQRCIVLRARVKTENATKHPTIDNLMSCVNVLLTTHTQVVDWNVATSSCWIHRGRPEGPKMFESTVNQFENICNRGTGATLCLRLHKDTYMPDGMAMEGVTEEQDCVRLCQVTRNCVAVGWGVKSGDCFFHQVYTTLQKRINFHIYYLKIPCAGVERLDVQEIKANLRNEDDNDGDDGDDDGDDDKTQFTFRTLTDAQCKEFCSVCTCNNPFFKQVDRYCQPTL